MPVMMNHQSAEGADIWDLDDSVNDRAIVSPLSGTFRPTVENVLTGSSIFWRGEVVAGLEHAGRVRALPESMFRGGDFEEDDAPVAHVHFVSYQETDDDHGW